MFEAFAIAAAMIAASAGQLSTSPEYRLHLLTVCKSRIAAVPEGKRASVLEKDAEAFAFLHSNQGTDDVAKAVRKEAFRRIESSVERWAEDRRIDFLVEASSHTAMHAPELTKKIGLLALEIAKPIVKKRFPMLLDSPKGLEQPWCEPLNFSKLKSGTRVQTDFDDEKFTANGHWWGGNGLIGAVPHLKSNDEFRYSLLMLRDGNSLKIRGFPRRRLTFDQSIVISNGPVEYDILWYSVIIADDTVRSTYGGELQSLIISNHSIVSDGALAGAKCTLIARNKIKALVPTITKGSTLIAGDEIDVLKAKGGEFGTHIVGKDKYDPGVRFFAVADVGLELKEVDGKAIVKSVAEDSPFRKSLKPGDRINSINDKFFKDFDDCRRVLREACVVGYAFVNRTRDGGHARVLVDLLGYPKPLKAK